MPNDKLVQNIEFQSNASKIITDIDSGVQTVSENILSLFKDTSKHFTGLMGMVDQLGGKFSNLESNIKSALSQPLSLQSYNQVLTSIQSVRSSLEEIRKMEGATNVIPKSEFKRIDNYLEKLRSVSETKLKVGTEFSAKDIPQMPNLDIATNVSTKSFEKLEEMVGGLDDKFSNLENQISNTLSQPISLKSYNQVLLTIQNIQNTLESIRKTEGFVDVIPDDEVRKLDDYLSKLQSIAETKIKAGVELTAGDIPQLDVGATVGNIKKETEQRIKTEMKVRRRLGPESKREMEKKIRKEVILRDRIEPEEDILKGGQDVNVGADVEKIDIPDEKVDIDAKVDDLQAPKIEPEVDEIEIPDSKVKVKPEVEKVEIPDTTVNVKPVITGDVDVQDQTVDVQPDVGEVSIPDTEIKVEPQVGDVPEVDLGSEYNIEPSLDNSAISELDDNVKKVLNNFDNLRNQEVSPDYDSDSHKFLLENLKDAQDIIGNINVRGLAGVVSPDEAKRLQEYIEELSNLEGVSMDNLRGDDIQKFNKNIMEAAGGIGALSTKYKALITGQSKLEDALNNIKNGYGDIQQSVLNVIRTEKDPARAKNNEQIAESIERVNSVLHDTEKLQGIYDFIPESHNKIQKSVTTLMNAQKKLMKPNLGLEEYKKLKQTIFRSSSAIENLVNEYGDLVDVNMELGKVESKIRKQDYKYFPPEAKKEAENFANRLMLINARMADMVKSGDISKNVKEFENLRNIAQDLISEGEDFASSAEDSNRFFESNNVATRKLKMLMDSLHNMTNEESEAVRQVNKEWNETNNAIQQHINAGTTKSQLYKDLVSKSKDLKRSADEHFRSLSDTNDLLETREKTENTINKLMENSNALSEKDNDNVKRLSENWVRVNSELEKEKELNGINSKLYKEMKKISGDIGKSINDIAKNSILRLDTEEDTKKVMKEQYKLTKQFQKEEKEKRKTIEANLKAQGVGFLTRRREAAKLVDPAGRRMAMPAGLRKRITAVKGFGSDVGAGFKKVTAPLGKLTGAVTKMLPALGGLVTAFGGIAAFGAAMLFAQKKIFDARREIMAMAADTHELNKIIEGQDGSISVASSAIDVWRKKTESFVNVFGLGMDEVRHGFGDMVKAGFTLEETAANFNDVYVQSVLMGKSIGEAAQMAGQLRLEMGVMPEDASDSFRILRAQASDSGIAIGRFFDKVINAASGMAIYGHKVEEVGEAFGGLSKALALPEKAATRMAESLLNKFKDLSTEQQVMIGDMSGYTKKVNGLISQFKKGGEVGAAAMLELSEMGISEKEIARLSKIVDPLERSIAIMRSVKPGEQVKATMQALSKKALGIDITKASVEDLNDAFQSNTYRLEKIGEKFGLGREDVVAFQALTQGLVDNKDAQNKLLGQYKEMNMADIDAVFKNATDSQLKELSSIEGVLHEEFPELYEKFKKSGEDNVVKFIKALDTNIDDSMNLDEMLMKMREKAEEERLAEEMRMSTQSTFDALEQNVAVILNKIYTVIEPIVSTLSSWFRPLVRITKSGFLGLLKLINRLKPGGSKILKNFIFDLELDLGVDKIRDSLSEVEDNFIKASSDLMENEKKINYLEQKVKTGEITKEEKKRLELLKEENNRLAERKKLLKEERDEKRRLFSDEEKFVKSMKERKKTDEGLIDRYLEDKEQIDEDKKKLKKAQKKYGVVNYMTSDKKRQKLASNIESAKGALEESKKKIDSYRPVQNVAETIESKVKENMVPVAETVDMPNVVQDEKVGSVMDVIYKYSDSEIDEDLLRGSFMDAGLNEDQIDNVTSSLPQVIAKVEVPKDKNGNTENNSETVNDYRTVNINVNSRDRKYIEQVVRNALYNGIKK